MAQQFAYPKSETELQKLLDDMYRYSLSAIEKGDVPRIKGLYEIITSEPVILTAIHNIKANKGSKTPGVDGETIRPDILEQRHPIIVPKIINILDDYQPQPLRRVYIPKPGKTEKRPLGIPVTNEKIVEECIRLVLEPILEAQFFAHSYGFRPMRDTHQAIGRVNFLAHQTNYKWVIEGDIRKFFDSVNHSVLIRKLWHMGIRDQRVLMIIKKMLKAGILNEIDVNPIGTMQGGVLSPLLANVYLNSFDRWVTREWENKATWHKYRHDGDRITALKRTNLKPAYLVRYCDDWVILTNSHDNAKKIKYRVSKYLKQRLKIELSEEKTKITNIRKKAIAFLGIELKRVRGKSKSKLITKTQPDQARLKAKMKLLHQKTRSMRHSANIDAAIGKIHRINSIIRGIIEYYQVATFINPALGKYARIIRMAAYRALKGFGAKWVVANQTKNLIAQHKDYKTLIPAIIIRGILIGVTDLSFAKWQRTKLKNQKETPFTAEGRELYIERTQKRLRKPRDDILLVAHTEIMKDKQQYDIYNFEYFLNRGYALNRDKHRCRVCGKPISKETVHLHHVATYLPTDKMNRVPNLATVHWECHAKIHDTNDYSKLGSKVWKKILKFREKLHKKENRS